MVQAYHYDGEIVTNGDVLMDRFGVEWIYLNAVVTGNVSVVHKITERHEYRPAADFGLEVRDGVHPDDDHGTIEVDL